MSGIGVKEDFFYLYMSNYNPKRQSLLSEMKSHILRMDHVSGHVISEVCFTVSLMIGKEIRVKVLKIKQVIFNNDHVSGPHNINLDG